MKVGDLVRAFKSSRGAGKMGVVVKLFEKKIWRTDQLGIAVDWNKIDPEPVADVMIADRVVPIPLTDLEIVE
tara:strand:- start:209 stop:424 length:216 start_codon:yes stop_codon:yes gene_type:complete